MNISYFKSLPSKGMPHVSTKDIDFLDFLNAIKTGYWKDKVLAVRNETNKEKRQVLKRTLPAVTISGTFNERIADKIIQHSGLMAIDIDNNKDKSKILKDPYLFACFDSVSANGFVPIFKIDPTQHKESFLWIQAYLFNTYNIVCDPAPQNVASLRYVSYDPNLFVNQNALTAKFITKKEKPKSLPIILPENNISEIIQEAVNRRVNITESYQEYRDVAFAIADGLGEIGRNHFHALAQVSSKYDHAQADKQFDIALKGKATNKITIGTLFYMLKSNGIEIKQSEANKAALTSTLLAKKQNKDPKTITAQLQKLHNIPEIQAAKFVDEAYSRPDLNITNTSKDPENLIQNICEFIKQNYSLRKNEITGKIENNNTPFTKENKNTLWLKTRSVFNSTSVSFELVDRLIHSDFTPNYHPILDYIANNSHRHSNDCIERIIKSIRTDTPSAEIFIRKWLIGIAASLYGTPVRYVLALTGEQRSGKTEWFRRLLPNQLKPYYAESKLDAGKDDEILMCQKLIVMDDEMGGKSKQDEKRFKELTSKSVFSLRAPYGTHNEDYKRLAILCGTSNDPQIINDPTGNTRILPVNVISIDFELYNSVNKDDLFMEIINAYNQNENWQLDDNQHRTLTEQSENFQSTPVEHELIVKFFSIPSDEINAQYLTATEIKNHIESRTQQRIHSMTKFGISLRKILGNPISKKINGYPVKVYRVYENISTPTNPYEHNFVHGDDRDTMPF